MNTGSRWDCTYLVQKDVLGNYPISPVRLNRAASLQAIADPLTIVEITFGKDTFSDAQGLGI